METNVFAGTFPPSVLRLKFFSTNTNGDDHIHHCAVLKLQDYEADLTET